MPYTLITKNGKIMQFYIKDVAELYQQIHGGVVVTQQTIETTENIQKLTEIRQSVTIQM